MLASKWLPSWSSDCAYGLPKGPSAEVLAYRTCQQIALAEADGKHAGGLSYDLKKAFDTVPIRLALQIMRQRGADNSVLRAMEVFYGQHRKFFRMDGHYSEAFKASNGILQGCPLSMLVLTSLVATWIEALQAKAPEVTPRSFADDLSLVAQHAQLQQVKSSLRQSRGVTTRFVQLSGMQINGDKCFSFGNKKTSGCCPRHLYAPANLPVGWG